MIAYFIRASHPKENETLQSPDIESSNAILIPSANVSIVYTHRGNNRGDVVQNLTSQGIRVLEEMVSNPEGNPRGPDARVDVTEFYIDKSGIKVLTRGSNSYSVKLKREFKSTLQELTDVLSGDNITLLSKIAKKLG